MPLEWIQSLDKNTAYSTKEIADLLQITQNTARQRLNKAYEESQLLKKNWKGRVYWARKE